jgi:Rrf2 family protein
MVDIARHSRNGESVPIRSVAERQNLSRVYLSQLATPLKNAALLRSVWGNKGGFTLARPASQISVLDIVEAVDGPVCVIDCAVDPNYCDRSTKCEVLCIWRTLNDGIVGILSKQSLADLAAGYNETDPPACVRGGGSEGRQREKQYQDEPSEAHSYRR